jgi:hypothetical protein
MIATKIGKCVICGVKVTEKREFLPQLRMFEPMPEGITWEMRENIIKWRDIPILCEVDRNNYEVMLRS